MKTNPPMWFILRYSINTTPPALNPPCATEFSVLCSGIEAQTKPNLEPLPFALNKKPFLVCILIEPAPGFKPHRISWVGEDLRELIIPLNFSLRFGFKPGLALLIQSLLHKYVPCTYLNGFF